MGEAENAKFVAQLATQIYVGYMIAGVDDYSKAWAVDEAVAICKESAERFGIKFEVSV